MLIRFDKFSGLAPRFEPHLLPINAATVAKNCNLASGAIRSWKDPLFVVTPSKAGTKLSIFKYEGSWFHWITDVDAVRGPLASDAYDRVYWSGEGAPKMGGNDILTAGGGTDYPTNSYTLGIPAPTGAPAVAASGTPDPDPPELTDQETRFYVYTFVSGYGEEGPPSPPSAQHTWSPGEGVTVSGMDSAPAGAYNITQRKIYRTNTGSTETEYQLVATIPIATASYADTVDSANLGAVLQSTTWDAPPAGLFGLNVHPAGFLFGCAGKELCLSVPYRPHAWPHRIPFSEAVIGAKSFGSSIVVLTKGLPYLVTGNDPEAMSVEKFEIGNVCVSKRGIVDMGYAVAYPCPEGIAIVGVDQMKLATDSIMTKEEWKSYKPESIHAYLYDGKYVGFYDNGATQGGFIFDPSTAAFVELDLYATAGHLDTSTGDLYLQVGNNIVKWNAGATSMSYQWKSKPVRAAGPENLGAAQVFSDTYPITLKVYADGVLKHTQSVANSFPFRLPSGFTAYDWQIEVIGSVGVNAAFLANSITELGTA